MIDPKERCKEQVAGASGWRSHRCERRAVADGYCKQHHPDSVKARQEAAARRYEERLDASPYRQIKRLTARIAELEAELAKVKNGANE